MGKTPVTLSKEDGNKPDGITLLAYKHGKPLCWDCTCVDTFESTYVNESTVQAGSAADAAETVKRIISTISLPLSIITWSSCNRNGRHL